MGFNGLVIVIVDVVFLYDLMRIVNGLKVDIEKILGVDIVVLVVLN